VTDLPRFWRVFIKEGFPHGLSYAMMMAGGMWLAGQPLSWVVFFLWLFGFAIFVTFVEYFRAKNEISSSIASSIKEVAPSDENAMVLRHEKTYKTFGFIFLACLFTPLPLYYFGCANEYSAWPLAIGLTASTLLPLAYIKLRLLRNGGSIKEFLIYGEMKDGVSPKIQILLFSVYAIASIIVTSIAIYQLVP